MTMFVPIQTGTCLASTEACSESVSTDTYFMGFVVSSSTSDRD